ncbi:hypothetical protein D3OALGA1CA_5457 [Olavius algarvensis associated proteobacterium Delta 3]|nr:hypothetical protein D3OALGB2SA_3748 [Olavius algarvensis associated proteobacterium Delta 3]CAB5167182.1 hypothetical protein D3OALGA1CA_5457 [Olavius algarvensis associated proteobacterium Delta 3]
MPFEVGDERHCFSSGFEVSGVRFQQYMDLRFQDKRLFLTPET